MLVYPPKLLDDEMKLTNIELGKLQARNPRAKYTGPTTRGELLKFKGLMLLMTRFEFGSRRSLWSSMTQNKYIPAPKLGQTGMTRDRFDNLMSCYRMGQQPATRPQGMSDAEYRWMLINNAIDRFNEHGESCFHPSDSICTDESMCRWYGIGGNWINMGLPHYVAMDRKPENGCEVQNCCDGVSGIMLRMKLVKSPEDEATPAVAGAGGITLTHGGKVLWELVQPWRNTHRVVCGDSFFASVSAARHLYRNGLRFIGVVKQATKEFPMQHLSNLHMPGGRGDRRALVSDIGEDGKLMSLVWVDRERRYFIATTDSMREGRPYSRHRWRQQQKVDSNAPPDRVEVTIPQPEVCETYYEVCAKIDQHNRHRQDTFTSAVKFGDIRGCTNP